MRECYTRRFQPATGKTLILTSYQTYYHRAVRKTSHFVVDRKKATAKEAAQLPPSAQTQPLSSQDDNLSVDVGEDSEGENDDTQGLGKRGRRTNSQGTPEVRRTRGVGMR